MHFLDILRTSSSWFPSSNSQANVAPQSQPYNEFSAIIAQNTQLLDEDNEDNKPVFISENWTNIRIANLFNFGSSHWSSRYACFAALTFEEELELYNLLEMDAEGDDDPEARFYDTTEDILLG